ncbi:prephenate dehydrogenase [Marinoscillum pacificum]|uniref:prephenate dehydrogenase n=1 Tax=Marinoscillum pacificum TaxID=392723 RepID=UPI0021579F5D|nr:prephenate dehydrogenase [Marinoscillum pacificum]
MKVLFVGTGLIGGSFSLAMQKHGLLSEAGGFSRKESNLDRSVELGLISKKFTNLEDGIKWADWVILSIPVDVIDQMLPGILDMIREEQVIVDFGSTKGKICETVKSHEARARFIAAHPIAGTEYSGPEAAFASLFEEKLMIICEDGQSNPAALMQFEKVCKTIGMKLEYMDAEAHDRHLAYISHLSHITSYSLSNAVLDKEKDGQVILELAGSGFASTVRLAKSSPEMWAPIFMENKKMVLEALDAFLSNTAEFKRLLEADDLDGMFQFLEKGRAIKRVIK